MKLTICGVMMPALIWLAPSSGAPTFGVASVGQESTAAAAAAEDVVASEAVASAGKPQPPSIDKSRLAGCDVHVLGAYMHNTTTDDRTWIVVRNTGRPMVIVLCSYMESQWHVKLEPGADVRQIIVSGYFDQELPDPPADVPVAMLDRRSVTEGEYFWAYGWNTKEGRHVRRQIKALTGLEVTTFQGHYEATRHIIDGSTGQISELDKEPTAAGEESSPLPSGMEQFASLLAAYRDQLQTARKLGRLEEARQYEDVIAYTLLTIRLQRKELETTLTTLKAELQVLKKSGLHEDSEQHKLLTRRIREFEEVFGLLETYREYLPKRADDDQVRNGEVSRAASGVNLAGVQQEDSTGPTHQELQRLQAARLSKESEWTTLEKHAIDLAIGFRRQRESADESTLANLKADLTKVVTDAFQQQMELQQIRLQLAALELAQLTSRLESRKAAADRIVTRRVEDLITGADLSWPRTPAEAEDPLTTGQRQTSNPGESQ